MPAPRRGAEGARPQGRGACRRGAPAAGALAALLVAALALAGCGVAYEHSQQRMLELQAARREARGGWIVMRFPVDRSPSEIAGELLFAGPDTVFVLAADGVTAVPAHDLPKAAIRVYAGPDSTGNPVLALRKRRSPGRWRLLAPHTRFPQGLPPDFGRSPREAP